MNIDIRAYVKKNFEGSTSDDIRQSIEESIAKNDEVLLPGLGVLFEILWQNTDKDLQEKMLAILASNLK